MSKHVFNRKRWENLTIFEQMGNIGSEVGRALTAKGRGDEESLRAALFRGLDLLDATATMYARQKSPKTKEILRARELFSEAASTNKEIPGLENYFTEFALVARRNR